MSEKIEQVSSYPVVDIALQFPQAIRILNRYELDYCCHGQRTFREACERAHADPQEVWSAIEKELPIPGPELRHRFTHWEAPLLIDFIVQNHHEFVRIAVPHLQEILKQLSITHADFLHLQEIRETFDAIAELMLDHLPKEEEIVFPAIRRITTKEVTATYSPITSNIQRPILTLENEHDRAMELLKLLRSLTDHYKVPHNACPTLQMAFKLMEEFDEDLIQHIHLENNILFPKVKA